MGVTRKTTTKMLVRSSLNAVRQFATSAARRGHDPAVMPGYPPPASNLPMGDIDNRWKLTLKTDHIFGIWSSHALLLRQAYDVKETRRIRKKKCSRFIQE